MWSRCNGVFQTQRECGIKRELGYQGVNGTRQYSMLARDRKAAQGTRIETSPGADSVHLFCSPCSKKKKKRECISRRKMDKEVKSCQGRTSGEVEDLLAQFLSNSFCFSRGS